MFSKFFKSFKKKAVGEVLIEAGSIEFGKLGELLVFQIRQRSSADPHLLLEVADTYDNGYYRELPCTLKTAESLEQVAEAIRKVVQK